MNPEKIRFNCPSCGIQLDVPAALAGVTGPCPSCQSSITAPAPQQPSQPIAPPQEVAAPVPAAAPPQQPAPAPAQIPVEQEPAPLSPPVSPPPVRTEPITPEPSPQPPSGQNVFPTVLPEPTPAVHPTPEEPPFPIQPEPATQIPAQRSNDGHASEPPSNEEVTRNSPGQSPSPTKQGSRLPSIIFLFLFLIAATVLILTVLNVTGVVGINDLKSLFGLGEKKGPPPAVQSLSPSLPGKTAEPAVPEPSAEGDSFPETLPPRMEETNPPVLEEDPLSVDPESPAESIPPPQLPEGEDFREGETPLPKGLSRNFDDKNQVQEILESFLQAKNLGERQDMVSTDNLSSEKLAASPLAQTFPKPTSILFQDKLTDKQERRSDFFYVVSWDGENNTPAKPITVELHKWPGSEPARLHGAAFLEFYQQKLARYAASPLDRPARFYVMAECVAKCFESDSVPDHNSKATLKLLSFPNDRSPVKAYFDKKGDLLEDLKSFRDGLAFRKAIPLTVTLEWSPDRGNNQRYLEVRIIDSFDWHP